jgi:hypothetical protein
MVMDLMKEYRNRAAQRGAVSATIPSVQLLPSAVEAWQTLDAQYNLDDMFGCAGDNEGGTLVEDEYNSYIKAPLSKPGTNILSFWSMSDTTHPTLFTMAMDYLPIQASSVPSGKAPSVNLE